VTQSKLVLIVEDNRASLMLARDILQATGYRTLEAGTADEALALAREHLPDLILMDIQLPHVDGVTALGWIKRDARLAAVPVVALTAFAMSDDRERFLQAGFAGYIAKPFDVADFVRDVAQYCEGRAERGAGSED
jgi:two-component system cell cycle response regulator DivK